MMATACREGVRSVPGLPVRMTIKIGTGLRTGEEFHGVLVNSGFKVSSGARNVLRRRVFTVAEHETEIDLVDVTVWQLGFRDGAIRRHIYERASLFGLHPCPAEVGPQLRFQYKNQPLGERLIVAMEPISDFSGNLYVLEVEHAEDGLWLGGSCGDPHCIWGGSRHWVFMRPRELFVANRNFCPFPRPAS